MGGEGGSAGGLLQGVCTLPRGCTSRREGQGYYDGFQQKAKEGCVGRAPFFCWRLGALLSRCVAITLFGMEQAEIALWARPLSRVSSPRTATRTVYCTL